MKKSELRQIIKEEKERLEELNKMGITSSQVLRAALQYYEKSGKWKKEFTKENLLAASFDLSRHGKFY